MSLRYSTLVDSPQAEVFAWHERPGALVRLSPPWQPVRVVAEASSLDGGEAVLGLPGGLRWVAKHSDYEPPHRFVDELTSLPLRWRHTHEFFAVSESTTEVTDVVDTPIPARFLLPLFSYRHDQLADDLSAHRRARQAGIGRLTVAITGSHGLIGNALAAFLTTGGHRVIRLVRGSPRHADERQWLPEQPDPDLLVGTDALVHLAGASIAGRFNTAHKRAVRDSRVGPTWALAELAARTIGGPRALVVASAIGYYGPDRGDEVLTENSPKGTGFLADVVADWEAATTPAEDGGLRVVKVRTGIVQSPQGGVLRLLRPLFAAGLGGRLGSGEQWLSWIGLDDIVDIYHRALYDSALVGPVNAVAPNPVTNAHYTTTLAKVVHRPAALPVPGVAPRLLLGSEGAQQLALASQRVDPARLHEAGHHFRHPHLHQALSHLLGRPQRDRAA
jgi:uncharacterized protein